MSARDTTAVNAGRSALADRSYACAIAVSRAKTRREQINLLKIFLPVRTKKRESEKKFGNALASSVSAF